MKAFLGSSVVIDADDVQIRERALALAAGKSNDVEIARACFVYVRDEIRHSVDYACGPVTCRASDVLKHGTGYCYAKSHLLGALLRANGIPAAFCYQRLAVGEKGPPFCLHGFNALYLWEFGWYRVDARGNKAGVGAEFTPPAERLAFRPMTAGEVEFEEMFPEPLAIVTTALRLHERWDELLMHLPDVAPIDFLLHGLSVRKFE